MSLNAGVKPGYKFKDSDWFEDPKLSGMGWEKYKVRVDGEQRFEVHYNINEQNCLYTDLKVTRWNQGG